jgi:hypothetical protein
MKLEQDQGEAEADICDMKRGCLAECSKLSCRSVLRSQKNGNWANGNNNWRKKSQGKTVYR